MEPSVGDTFLVKRSKTPSRGSCPCSCQWAGTRWSLRFFPTPTILGFGDSMIKTEVKREKGNLGDLREVRLGAMPARAPPCCPHASWGAMVSLRRASTQELQLLQENCPPAVPRAWLTPVSNPTEKAFWATSKKPQSCWLCVTSTVYDQKVKYSHKFFKSRILPCVFLRAERLFLFKTMNIKGRKEIF